MLFQGNGFDFQFLVGLAEEDGSRFLEFLFAFCGQEAAGSSSRTKNIHLRMALQVVLKAFGYIFALCNDSDMGRSEFPDFVHQEGIVGTTQ